MVSIQKQCVDNLAVLSDEESTGMDSDVPVKSAKIWKYKVLIINLFIKENGEKEFPIRAVAKMYNMPPPRFARCEDALW